LDTTKPKDYRFADGPTLDEIADSLDTLADIMVSDRIEELAGYNASFWRDAAAIVRARSKELELGSDI